jgi:hypothetical protein
LTLILTDANMELLAADLGSVDWDQSDALSIVMQGAVFQPNLIETANHCRHWRDLFPAAELILVISVSDVVCASADASATGGAPPAISLVAKHLHDGQLQFALDVIMATCNKVTFAPPTLPLPPIKSDSPKLNNMNFQLEAARQGLALATGRYVLRIRADMIFMNRSFLDQYSAAETMPKGKTAIFQQRVMISWLFTLNPYTNERMPLHFSDWFHFGLATDVRQIWQAPLITLQDSLYYRTHRHTSGSNAAERLFNIRLAVEQHIVYACFKPHFPGLKLDYHNDCSAIDLAMDILLDNFAICDNEHAGCIMEKYAAELTDPAKQIHCITRGDWFAMAAARDVHFRTTLMPKILAFEDRELAEFNQSLPRTYDVHRLHTDEGRVLNSEIVAVSRQGVLFWGPYTNLPQGAYRATVNVTSLEGRGSVTLHVKMNTGRELLAEKCINVQGTEKVFTVDFDVLVFRAWDVEVVCKFDQLRQFSVSGVTFAKRTGVKPVPIHQQDMPRTFGAESLPTRVGTVVDGEIVSTGMDGTLFYGPYTTVAPGQYLATVVTSALEGIGTVHLKASLDFGDRTLAETTFTLDGTTRPALQLAFDVPGTTAAKLEVTCDIRGLDRIAVSRLNLSERPATSAPTRKNKLLGLFQ